jgi:hypothetical protein
VRRPLGRSASSYFESTSSRICRSVLEVVYIAVSSAICYRKLEYYDDGHCYVTSFTHCMKYVEHCYVTSLYAL